MDSALSLECRRTYRASAARVFRALTEPAVMERWWSPDPAVQVDVLDWVLRVGGTWRFAYRFPDGRVIHVGGTLREVDPERRLVLTWTWEPPDVHAGTETLVTIALDESEEGTTVLVRHERFPSSEIRDRHDAGWTATLDRLGEALA